MLKKVVSGGKYHLCYSQVDLVKECGADEICNSDLDLDVLILLTQ